MPVSSTLKEYPINIELHSSILGLKIDAAEPVILSFLFFFLVQTWHLHYPQCISTADS